LQVTWRKKHPVRTGQEAWLDSGPLWPQWRTSHVRNSEL
jgi:hypothetical protein